MKKIYSGLLAIAAFTFSASAQVKDNTDQKKANDNNPGYQWRHDGRMMGIRSLNLNDAQKQQMKSINEDFKNKIQALNKNDNMTVKDFRAQRKALMQDRKNKISGMLTPDQKTQFEKFGNKGFGKGPGRGFGRGAGRGPGGKGFNQGRGEWLQQMKSNLGLTNDQESKIKAANETFAQKAKAIRENQSLTPDQKKEQIMTLQKEKQENFKTFLTAEQVSKLQQMKASNGRGFGSGAGKRGPRGRGFNRGRESRLEQMKSNLGLTDDQVSKIKAANQGFAPKIKAIRENQSLTPDQKKEQIMTLQKDRQESIKSFLTVEQISKQEQMKGDRKEKEKNKDGKEK